jgi:hypothetical protein
MKPLLELEFPLMLIEIDANSIDLDIATIDIMGYVLKYLLHSLVMGIKVAPLSSCKVCRALLSPSSMRCSITPVCPFEG